MEKYEKVSWWWLVIVLAVGLMVGFYAGYGYGIDVGIGPDLPAPVTYR